MREEKIGRWGHLPRSLRNCSLSTFYLTKRYNLCLCGFWGWFHVLAPFIFEGSVQFYPYCSATKFGHHWPSLRRVMPQNNFTKTGNFWKNTPFSGTDVYFKFKQAQFFIFFIFYHGSFLMHHFEVFHDSQYIIISCLSTFFIHQFINQISKWFFSEVTFGIRWEINKIMICCKRWWIASGDVRQFYKVCPELFRELFPKISPFQTAVRKMVWD